MNKKTRRIGIMVLGISAVTAGFVFLQMASIDDTPLPFGNGPVLAGQLSEIGRKNTIPVVRVAFPVGVHTETLIEDKIFLVSVPNDSLVTTGVLDLALSRQDGTPVNYFGYRYTTPNASAEKAAKDAPSFLTRFPGTFFASQKARDEDETHGNALSNFEASGVELLPTGGAGFEFGMLQKNSLYMIIVNETVPVTLRIRSDSAMTAGSLTVTQSTLAMKSRQLLGGTLVPYPVLALTFGAQGEDIDVFGLRITVDSPVDESNRSLDRLELFFPGASTAFATATTAACGSQQVPTGTYCASMQNDEFVVGAGQTKDVLVRPRMKNDVNGSHSNDRMTARFVGASVNGPNGEGVVQARGVTSATELSLNDGSGKTSGRIFIGGGSNAAPNTNIVGLENLVVNSQIISVTTNGQQQVTGIPFGDGVEISNFRFLGAPNANTRGGTNRSHLYELYYTVDATNVELDAGSFEVFNADQPSAVMQCGAVELDGGYVTGPITGAFLIQCMFDDQLSEFDIVQNEYLNLAVHADVLNPAINPSAPSVLSVSIKNLADPSYHLSDHTPPYTGNFSQSGSHIVWLDMDNEFVNQIFWIERTNPSVTSTVYSCAANECVYVASTQNQSCGNGVKEGQETCDDSNTANGDGCSSACAAEEGYTCPAGGACTPVCGNGVCESQETAATVPGHVGAPYYCPQDCSVCGNGVRTGTESCDDGNTVNADGCSAVCAIESGFACAGTPSACTRNPVCGNGQRESSETCDDGDTVSGDGCDSLCRIESDFKCSGSPTVCTHLVVCGNGQKETGETCDDGNTVNGDGCKNICTIEQNFYCIGSAPSVCSPSRVCGNGATENGEECDDGNLLNGDQCSAMCLIEVPYWCDAWGNCMQSPYCGDGYIQENEQCDNRNNTSGDGCNSMCRIEIGFMCTGAPSMCTRTPVCGDGYKATSESCDDHNVANGDGCTSACTIEATFSCIGSPSTCTHVVCGNGRRETGENCDDHNIANGDGCTSACMIEFGYFCTGATPSVCLSN